MLVSILTLTCVHNLATSLGIYFALYIAACVAMMQAGETKREQFFSMLLAGAAFLFLLGFGLMAKPHTLLANIAMVIFAFIAFYLPNIGLRYKLPPVLAMIFYVFVISMPQNAPLASSMLAGLIAVIVAISIYFLFWPYEIKHELTLLAQTAVHEYRSLLKNYLAMVHKKNSNVPVQDLENSNIILTNVSKILATYEKLNDASNLKKEEATYFDNLYLRLYSLLQINTMILERFPSLSPEARHIAQQLLRNLKTQFQAAEYRFDAMVPHSLIAKNIIGRSLHLGKVITESLSLRKRKIPGVRLREEEFNALLTKLIADHTDISKRFAFGLLRTQELIDNIHNLQETVCFDVNQAVFL